jgi:hypothetical protein
LQSRARPPVYQRGRLAHLNAAPGAALSNWRADRQASEQNVLIRALPLVVLWRNPGTRQKPIRATVARFAYLTDERNDKIDVEQIPHYAN